MSASKKAESAHVLDDYVLKLLEHSIDNKIRDTAGAGSLSASQEDCYDAN
jgi:hypothetical protein